MIYIGPIQRIAFLSFCLSFEFNLIYAYTYKIKVSSSYVDVLAPLCVRKGVIIRYPLRACASSGSFASSLDSSCSRPRTSDQRSVSK